MDFCMAMKKLKWNNPCQQRRNLTFTRLWVTVGMLLGLLPTKWALGASFFLATSLPRRSQLFSAREASFSVDIDSGFTSVNAKEDNNHDIVHQRHLRFAGVGRLYAQGEELFENDDAVPSPNVVNDYLAVIDRLARSTVAVVGLGGIGSWAAEALCRSGVGNLILIDLDDICISNTNRQLHATSSSVGQLKIDKMRSRLLDINPHCNITNVHDFVSTENVHSLLDGMLPSLTVCLDAIDGAREKTALVAACTERQIPIVTCGGAAGRMDPTKIVVNDLTIVTEDRLLATCRKSLRQDYGFEKGIAQSVQQKSRRKTKKWDISAVYSTEIPKGLPSTQDESSLRRCDGALGTACFVTGTFGFVAAGKVVDMIATDSLLRPQKR